MSDLLSIRLKENEKDALALSSRLSGMPVSKVIIPFISEGVKVSLGAALLFRIDTNVYNRDHFEGFIDLVHGPIRTGGQIFSMEVSEDENSRVPKIVWDFFELLSATRSVGRLNSSLEEVELQMDTGYVTPEFLGTLCHSIGDTYISMGGSLESINYQLASEIFFNRMLYFFYRANAKGTARALTTQWYSKGDLISKIVGEMNERYNEKTGSSVLEAIVVSSPQKRRGRPKKERRRELPPANKGFVARELR